MAGKVEGQVALVTGAALGIGHGIARVLAREGARLALCDIRADVEELAAELRAGGAEATAMIADVREPADVRRFVDSAAETYGRIALLVSNAGVWRATSPIDDPWEKAIEDFDYLVDTNLKGLYLCGRAVIPRMAAQGSGNIVNIATDHICPPPGFGTGGGTRMDAYDASKWGINGFTQGWARVLAPRGVRVNALCMDATDSHMIRTALGQEPSQELLDRWMRPEQIGELLVELVAEGPEGRTGENIGIWLGHEVALPPRREPLPHRFG